MASLEFQGLTGVAVVTLEGGSPSAPPLTAPAGKLPLLVASETAGVTMSESARKVLGRLDKILAENSDDIHSIVANIKDILGCAGQKFRQSRLPSLAGWSA